MRFDVKYKIFNTLEEATSWEQWVSGLLGYPYSGTVRYSEIMETVDGRYAVPITFAGSRPTVEAQEQYGLPSVGQITVDVFLTEQEISDLIEDVELKEKYSH